MEDLYKLLVVVLALFVIWNVVKLMDKDAIIIEKGGGEPEGFANADAHVDANTLKKRCDHDWSVKHRVGCGDGCNCGDVLWHYMSPRMKLIDNCLDCGKTEVDGPCGITEPVVINHDASLDNSFQQLSFSPLPMHNGLPPMQPLPCLARGEKAQCGCSKS